MTCSGGDRQHVRYTHENWNCCLVTLAQRGRVESTAERPFTNRINDFDEAHPRVSHQSSQRSRILRQIWCVFLQSHHKDHLESSFYQIMTPASCRAASYKPLSILLRTADRLQTAEPRPFSRLPPTLTTYDRIRVQTTTPLVCRIEATHWAGPNTLDDTTLKVPPST